MNYELRSVLKEAFDKILPIPICPICGRKLHFRVYADGFVCKNWKCPNYWKRGRGSVFRVRSREGGKV